MSRIPFTVYDFFAYLSSGALIVAVGDYLYGYQWLLQDNISPILAIFLVFLAYVTGHIVAHFSSLCLEQLFIGKLLGKPSRTLLEDQAPQVLRWIFPGYFRALPPEIQQRIRAQADTRRFLGTGEALFLHAYSAVTQSERSQNRLDIFLSIYGFSRNLSFAFIVISPLLFLGAAANSMPPNICWGILSLTIGIILFYRYLKFFRHYSYITLISYSELPLEKKEQTIEI